MAGAEVHPLPDATHIFSHVEWHMRGYLVSCSDETPRWKERDLVWVTPKELSEQYAIPGAYRAFVGALTDFWMHRS